MAVAVLTAVIVEIEALAYSIQTIFGHALTAIYAGSAIVQVRSEICVWHTISGSLPLIQCRLPRERGVELILRGLIVPSELLQGQVKRADWGPGDPRVVQLIVIAVLKV